MAQTGAPIKALFMGRRRAADREDAVRGIFFSFFFIRGRFDEICGSVRLKIEEVQEPYI